MILGPEEIERRLCAVNDPELAELLESVRRSFSGEEPDAYTAHSAPYWNKRIGFLVLAGLFALSAGFSATVSRPHSNGHVQPLAATPAMTIRHVKPIAHRALNRHAIPAAPHRNVAPTAAARSISVTAPDETLIRQARAQLLHERELAMHARAQAAYAQQQARLAIQQRADAQAWAQAEALAQARAEARAEALAQAQAEAAPAQREREAVQQDQALQNASDPNIKPGEASPPSTTGRIPGYPGGTGPQPMPVPGPVDPTNCTPHRANFFRSALDHVRVGPTTAGVILDLIHH